jgi:hypothetical protein
MQLPQDIAEGEEFGLLREQLQSLLSRRSR